MLSNFNTVSFLWGCPVSCEFVCCCAVVNLLLFSAEIVCVLVWFLCFVFFSWCIFSLLFVVLVLVLVLFSSTSLL